MTPEEALTSGFYRWLEHVAGGATPIHQVRPGEPISPFVTSLRVTKYVSYSLAAAEEGRLVGGTRSDDQRIVDLRAIGLLGNGSPARLSAVGQSVLDRWRYLGVADENDAHEVVRCAVLSRSGLAAGSQPYRGHMRFWLSLRELRAPKEWFADPQNLVLVTYLNRTDPNRYNPFLVLGGLGAGFPDYADWVRWAKEMPAPAGWSQSRLAHVLQRVSGLATRSRGIVTYCRAMEAVYLAAEDPRNLVRSIPLLTEA